MTRFTLTGALLLLALSVPRPAAAFCGFYVSGAGTNLYNRATMVVLMRDGTRTVLSMQNNYEGPPEDFAMIVPVPVVLSEDNVKTLPHAVFRRVDELAAPRLVEYWEDDPCRELQPPPQPSVVMAPSGGGGPPIDSAAQDLGVTVEAQFVVGEYQIVILSARDSSGLDTWLRRERYRIPEGAEPVLRPYVQAGTKFFVARVDLERVTRVDGRVMLSPLRFHYDADEFSLPVRLGLLNSAGTQDLIVHILARGQRYEVANYRNITIPTNIIVGERVRTEFGPFYASLFDRLLERNPNHVVTEYSWDAMSCDPCPTEPLTAEELGVLGNDIVGAEPYSITLTRLHYRYGAEGLGQDLVFRAAGGIIGGRGVPDEAGHLSEEGAQPSPSNQFQGRYVMLNWWQGAIGCGNPVRGRWGGPPNDAPPSARQPQAATNLAFAERGRALSGYLAEDIPELDVRAGVPSGPRPTSAGCASCSAVSAGSLGALGSLALAALLAGVLWRRRRHS